MTTIIFRPNGSYSQTESSSRSWSKTENNSHSPVNEKEAASSSKSHNASFNGSLMAFRRLNNKGRNLSLGARFGYSDSESDSYSDSKTKFSKRIVFLIFRAIQTEIVIVVTGVYQLLIQNLYLKITFCSCVMNLLIANSYHNH